MVKIAIFDYGSGNIFSLKTSLENIGAEVHIINSFDYIGSYSGLLFPGVGNFDPAIKTISSNSKKCFSDIVYKIPILGICLGMELLFEKSDEGNENGLNIFKGEVILLPNKLIVPHMGWNNILIEKYSTLLENIPNNSLMYFIHSYRIQPKNNRIIVANSNYGVKIPAIIEKNNLYGTQFHPEKSGKFGLLILKNFLRQCNK